ncbi:hypothetical protein [Bradyrhizobium japonicum]|uniref:hypothetical protein n=1 Tax=Bradyrhizobium japonicum TaxID=375 RepID=UPI0035E2ECA8
MAIEIYLQRNHFRVTIADGEAGLRALENEQVDLMMIDIFMPHMRGRRVDPDPSRARAGHSADCDVRLRLRKPFKTDTLLAAIKDSLAEHRAVSAIGLAR